MANYTCSASCNVQGTLNRICTHLEETLIPIKAIYTTDTPPPPPRLRKALSNLSRDASRIITRVDKGDAKVVLDVDRYTQLAWKHLTDTTTYSPFDSNPTPDVDARIIQRVACSRSLGKTAHYRTKLSLCISVCYISTS